MYGERRSVFEDVGNSGGKQICSTQGYFAPASPPFDLKKSFIVHSSCDFLIQRYYSLYSVIVEVAVLIVEPSKSTLPSYNLGNLVVIGRAGEADDVQICR